MTALNDALRAVTLDGDSIVTLGRECAVLAGWGGVSFAAVLKWFRWQ